MKSSSANRVLLVVSVLALIGGPLVFALFMYTPAGQAAGLAATLLGAIGLWIGMRRIES